MTQSSRASSRVWHRVYLRTARGGSEVPFESALEELRAVFSPDQWRVHEVHRAFSFVDGWFVLPERALVPRLARLGYTAAVVEITAYAGQGPEAPKEPRRRRARWSEGPARRGADLWVHRVLLDLDTIPRPDADALARAPAGEGIRQRRLSGLDARFVANLAGVSDGALVLDPFAGRGVLARALLERDLRVIASEREAFLLPGLVATLGPRAFRADAIRMPLPAACVDGVVSEPPFAAAALRDVERAMLEAVRVLRPGGALTLLLSLPLADALGPVLGAHGFGEELRARVLRQKQPGVVVRWRVPADPGRSRSRADDRPR